MNKFVEFIVSNFAHVAPILIAAVFAIGIALDRFKVLFKTYPLHGRHAFFEHIREFVLKDQLQEAVALCNQYSGKPTAQIVKAGLLRAHLPEQMVTDGVNIAVGEWSERIMKRSAFLAMIANVATLLGLFGTIAGLIQSFEAVGFADPQQKSAILAQGISTAMNATMLGLGVAIPCMVAFSFIMNKSNRLVSDMDQDVLETLDLIRARAYGVDTKKVA